MEETKKEFICNKCGCCCKHVNYYEPAEFLDRGDGTCKYYNEETKLCSIYDFRPEICRVDKMYKLYKDKMTWNEYVDLNYESCEELRQMEKKKVLEETLDNKEKAIIIDESIDERKDLIDNDWYQNKVVINKTDEDNNDYLYDDDDYFGE